MDLVHLPELLKTIDPTERKFVEFGRSADLSVGLYVVPEGQEDHQSPHAEDEVYHVLGGKGRIDVAGEVADVGPGSVVFVPAGVPHRFLDVERALVVFVAFGPAYRSRASG